MGPIRSADAGINLSTGRRPLREWLELISDNHGTVWQRLILNYYGDMQLIMAIPPESRAT